MGLYYTATNRVQSASERIAAQTAKFLRNGGRIKKIPKGQGAYSLKIREVKKRGRGTRIAWDDERLSLSSAQSRAASIKSMQERKAEQEVKREAGRPKALSDADVEKARSLLADGQSLREVAAEMGVSHGTISKIAQQ